MITKDQLKVAMPTISAANIERYLKPLNDTMEKYQISTPSRIAMFLAQIAHESLCLAIVKENLNYSAAGLMKVFPNFFDAAKASAYASKPEAIGNLVYANRMGNGNEMSGDGYRFRGRGPIEITGRDLYDKAGKALGIDLIKQPELLEGPIYGMLSTGWYWATNGLNIYCDKNDFQGLTRKINGGLNGITSRLNYLKLSKSIFLNT